MKPSQYEQQALDVAQKIGIEIKAAFQGEQCPEWAVQRQLAGGERRDRRACSECGTVHGDKYRVTIKRSGRNGAGASISFDYWASWADCNVEITGPMVGSALAFKKAGLDTYSSHKYHVGDIVRKQHKPSVYSILTCVSSDLNNPTDADAVHAEFGEMKPSQAEAIAAHARKLQAFFTEEERELLSEVQ